MAYIGEIDMFQFLELRELLNQCFHPESIVRLGIMYKEFAFVMFDNGAILEFEWGVAPPDFEI